jgi:hypothetical protein
MVAKDNIPAFSFVGEDDLEAKSVPKGSVEDDDLTKDEFDDLEGTFVTSSPILSGQRIDNRYVISGDNSGFGGVLPDERIVAATSSVAGAAVGTIQAGDVVDIGGQDGQSFANYAKVLCVSKTAAGCSSVLPSGSDINASDSNTGNDDENAVVLLLATFNSEAGSVAGQNVVLALNPFCRVDQQGYFYSPRGAEGQDFLCDAPKDRIASQRDNQDNQTTTDEEVSQ